MIDAAEATVVRKGAAILALIVRTSRALLKPFAIPVSQIWDQGTSVVVGVGRRLT
jgi:hypothetical protein